MPETSSRESAPFRPAIITLMSEIEHYDDSNLGTIGQGFHFPPGESGCLMDRNATLYCSACRTGLNLPLDVDNETAINQITSDILPRYPPGW